jgi:hypothetical protein
MPRLTNSEAYLCIAAEVLAGNLYVKCYDEMDVMPVDEAQKLFFQIPNIMLKCAGLINTNEEEYVTHVLICFSSS